MIQTHVVNTPGELEGFIDRGGPFFMLEFDIFACDLNCRPSVGYTYESDDSVSSSWIDHIPCSQHVFLHKYCSFCLNILGSLSIVISN